MHRYHTTPRPIPRLNFPPLIPRLLHVTDIDDEDETKMFLFQIYLERTHQLTLKSVVFGVHLIQQHEHKMLKCKQVLKNFHLKKIIIYIFKNINKYKSRINKMCQRLGLKINVFKNSIKNKNKNKIHI